MVIFQAILITHHQQQSIFPTMDSSDSCHPSPANFPSSWLPFSPLGSGSFGHVSLAINLHDFSLFAVKSAISASSHAFLASLQNEFHILQSLQSPFIIRCLGAETFNSSTPCTSPCPDGHGSPQPSVRNLFLEYMEGGSLADALKQSGGRFCEELRIRRYTQSILQGLAYLHANGIVHCDIRSRNILIGSSGVKIADFGMAQRLSEETSSSPLRGNLRGTPLWMAPEVALGGEPLPCSDIWSLGCTVVEMVQGRPPWGHVVSSLEAALVKVGCSTQLPPLPDSIPAEAQDFLLKCLQIDSKARWTAEELLKHPFVCNMSSRESLAEDESAFCINSKVNIKAQLPSPRSTLELLENSDFDSVWEAELESPRLTDCVPGSPSCNTGRRAPAPHDDDAISLMQAERRSDWIVVKRYLSPSTSCCNRPSEMPFMLQPVGLVQIKRASEVSYTSADFLRKCNRSFSISNTSSVG